MRKLDIRTVRKRLVVEPLYVAYYKDMLRYAAFLLKSVYDAEDAVHTVFLHAMQKWNVLADMEEKDKKNYLFAAVRNAALDIIRRKRRNPEISIEEPEAQERAVCYMTRELRDAVELLDGVAKWHKDILTDAYVLGYSSREIAEMWGMTQNTIEKRLDRAKAAVRGLRREKKYW